jgi:hypothetical protein
MAKKLTIADIETIKDALDGNEPDVLNNMINILNETNNIECILNRELIKQLYDAVNMPKDEEETMKTKKVPFTYFLERMFDKCDGCVCQISNIVDTLVEKDKRFGKLIELINYYFKYFDSETFKKDHGKYDNVAIMVYIHSIVNYKWHNTFVPIQAKHEITWDDDCEINMIREDIVKEYFDIAREFKHIIC